MIILENGGRVLVNFDNEKIDNEMRQNLGLGDFFMLTLVRLCYKIFGEIIIFVKL